MSPRSVKALLVTSETRPPVAPPSHPNALGQVRAIAAFVGGVPGQQLALAFGPAAPTSGPGFRISPLRLKPPKAATSLAPVPGALDAAAGDHHVFGGAVALLEVDHAENAGADAADTCRRCRFSRTVRCRRRSLPLLTAVAPSPTEIAPLFVTWPPSEADFSNFSEPVLAITPPTSAPVPESGSTVIVPALTKVLGSGVKMWVPLPAPPKQSPW